MRLTSVHLLAGLLCAAAPAAAQAPRPAAPPTAAAAPVPADRTTATFGDWVMRCESRPPQPTPGRGCELLQSLQDQRGQPVAQFAFGRIRRADPMRLVVLIPSNITVAVPMRLSLEDGAAPVPVTLRACGPRGCVADTELAAPVLARLRAREAQGKLEYRDALNGEVALPFSTRGFGQALDALAREGF
ncbi:MAG: invasion protein [Rubritepida sp.]|nr:invasion protein [Rubritepida sp.]